MKRLYVKALMFLALLACLAILSLTAEASPIPFHSTQIAQGVATPNSVWSSSSSSIAASLASPGAIRYNTDTQGSAISGDLSAQTRIANFGTLTAT